MIKAKWIGKGEGKVELKKETGTGEADAEAGVWRMDVWRFGSVELSFRGGMDGAEGGGASWLAERVLWMVVMEGEGC
jgi:hypothetical protein